MTRNQFKNLVAFCILMEGSGGILEKSPSYVEEKFNRYVTRISSSRTTSEEEYRWGLDHSNESILKHYLKKWKALIHILYEKN